MDREDQRGRNAPNQGSMIRVTKGGVAAFHHSALSRFPPPDFLNHTQQSLWTAALSDVPLEFFRARHIPMMIQYVRAVDRMMEYSDQMIADPDDNIAFKRWEKYTGITIRLERFLGLDVKSLVEIYMRARAETRKGYLDRRDADAGDDDADLREGLVYVGH